MIEVMRILRTEKFVARLNFSFLRSNRTELLEISHNPGLDPARVWTVKKPDESSYRIRCELKLFGPTGKIIEMEIITSNFPLTILTDCTGMTITATGKP